MAQLGLYIRTLREKQQISTRQLGNRVGVSASYISLIERGRRRASIGVLYPILAALGGDMLHALILLALDEGVPPEALPSV